MCYILTRQVLIYKTCTLRHIAETHRMALRSTAAMPPAAMMRRRSATVLLDFDGVVLRHSRASDLIRHRCERYVANMTGCHPDSTSARELNRALYTTYGHTSYGLYRLGYSASRQRFESYVYGSIDYDAMLSDVGMSHDATMRELHALCEHHDTYIYSNAPLAWCSEVMKRLPRPVLRQQQQQLGRNRALQFPEIAPGLRILQTPYLKPDVRAYEDIETMLSPIKYGRDVEKIYFVEDSFANIAPVLRRPRWRSMLFTDSTFSLPNGVTLVDSLSCVKQHVDHDSSFDG